MSKSIFYDWNIVLTVEKNQQSKSKTRSPEYSPSSKPSKNGKAQPNTKVRKLRKRIKKSKKNQQNNKNKNKTTPTKGIRSYSSHKQKIKKRKSLAASMLAVGILL
ncbi:MAG: hypothetical protein AAFY21_10070, partial [Cyanobacteria bacterium J06641_2]